MEVKLNEFDQDLTVRPLDSWDDLKANEQAKKTAIVIIRCPGKPAKMFLAGPSGSGKSATINHAVKTAACFSPNGIEPCGHCKGCERLREMKRITGLFSYFDDLDGKHTLHYLPINCRNTTSASIHKELEAIRHVAGMRIVHLEECASLRRLACDESITDIMDDHDFQTVKWFASAVRDHGLDGQFRRRFAHKVQTARPTSRALAELLAKRCRQYRISIDEPKTWLFLAERCWGVTGLAMAMLATTLVNDPPMLTKELVAAYPFPNKNPWEEEFFCRE